MQRCGSKILNTRNRIRDIDKNIIMRVEAPLEMADVAAFVTVGSVGIGRGVGVVGGGTMHELLSAFMMVPS